MGRFHAATANWTPKRHAPVRNIHDTDTRMNDLQTALMTHTSHPLYSAVAPLAEHILTEWQKRRSTVPVPQRICHGDLKISNLRFASEGPQPICLVDLDTIGPMELACELGDMWRSWCNPAGEDDPSRAAFDVALFRASARGFLDEAPELEASERAALPTATTRICLELASRFAADALNNNYFREDRVRFPDVGTHNLHRATTQLHLARSAAAHESICADILNA